MTYMFLDPGETTGIATFDDSGVILYTGQVEGIPALGRLLELNFEALGSRLLAVGYEVFRVDPSAKLGGSTLPASKVIGVIEYLCEKYSIRCVPIERKFKRIGYAWSNTRPPSDHSKSHGPDARAIGEYWLRINDVKGMDDA